MLGCQHHLTMLTFLRKIRKSLISSGSTRKPASPLGRYLLYAVGEIALVVIGILIALQINNWNQDRLNIKKEGQLIQALKIELSDNAQYLDWRIEYLRNQVEKRGIALLKSTGPNPEKIPLDSISSNILKIVYLLPYSPITAKFQQIMSSDESNLIRSDSLLQMLINYQSALELAAWPQFEMRTQILEHLQTNFSPLYMLRSQNKGMFENLMKEDYSANYFDLDGQKLLADPKFQGLVVTRLEANGYTIQLLIGLKRQIEQINAFINRNYDL